MVSRCFNSIALKAGTGDSWSFGDTRRLENEVLTASVVKDSLRAATAVSVTSILNRFWSLCGRKPHLRWADL